MQRMIHTIRPGDELVMIGPAGQHSERFVLAEVPELHLGEVWIYREHDAPMIIERRVALTAHFVLLGSRNGRAVS